MKPSAVFARTPTVFFSAFKATHIDQASQNLPLIRRNKPKKVKRTNIKGTESSSTSTPVVIILFYRPYLSKSLTAPKKSSFISL